jgi:hypothetical protein
MCGICYLRRGISIKSHRFLFNFFEDYVSKEHLGAGFVATEVPLNEHVAKSNLILPPIQFHNARRISNRGPDYFQAWVNTANSVECVDLEQLI